MDYDRHIISDLINENRVNYAKLYQLKNIRKEEYEKLIEQISNTADSILDTPDEYLKQCKVLFTILFSVVKITRQEKDALQDIKSNMEEIRRIRENGAIKKAD